MADIKPSVHNLDDHEDGIVVETRQVAPSHFLFKIESCSLISENGIDKYETSNFESGGYNWKLIIYPNGRDKDDHISMYLAMADTTSLPARWEVNAVFSIFLHNQKLDNFLSMRGRMRRFHALHPEWGFSKFISKKIFTDTSNGYLVDDSCVFGAEVFVIKNQGAVECLSLLKAGNPYKRSFDISNFSKLPDIWNSQHFVHGGHTWSLKLYPRGYLDGKGTHVSAFLKLIDSKTRKQKVRFTIGIKNLKNGENQVRNAFGWFVPNNYGDGWGFSTFIPIEDMNDSKKGFLVKDKCIFEVEIVLQAIVRNSFP